MKKFMKGRRGAHGSVSLTLTVLIVVAAVIFNIIIAALAGRYQWMYVNMNTSTVFSVSEDCKDYISKYVIPEIDAANLASGKNEKIKLIFCDDKENIEADSTQKHIHKSIMDLIGYFPEHIEAEYLDIWENPSVAREYGAQSTTDIVCLFGDRCETVDRSNFIVGEAYNGEKMLSACLMRLVQKEAPVCCITANHGETFGDFALLRVLSEVGYSLSYIDLANEDIPEDCELVVTYDPKQDLIVSDAVSNISEVGKLDEYMSRGGKYMVFLSADTFISGEHKNLENFLAGWGVKYSHEEGNDGLEACYLIKDAANSTTIDGYTVISKKADNPIAKAVLEGVESPNVFGNTTAIEVHPDYSAVGDGSYSLTVDGKERIFAPLFTTSSSAEAWAGGRAVERADKEPFTLMSISSQECDNGETAYLLASASVEFGAEEHMQSAVLGNSRSVMSVIKHMGKDNVPSSLTIKPFASLKIESLAVRDANIYATLLAIIPAVAFAAAGTVVLVRRKNT